MIAFRFSQLGILAFLVFLWGSSAHAERVLYQINPNANKSFCAGAGDTTTTTLEIWNPGVLPQNVTLEVYKASIPVPPTVPSSALNEPSAGVLDNIVTPLTIAAGGFVTRSWVQAGGCATNSDTPRGFKITVNDNSGFLVGDLIFQRTNGNIHVVTPINGGRPF